MNTNRYGWNTRGGPTTRQAMREIKEADSWKLAARQAHCQHNFILQSMGEGDNVTAFYECDQCGYIIDGDTDELTKSIMAPGMELPL